MSFAVGPVPPGAGTSAEFRFTQTESFVGLLRHLGASLLVSTYQANKLLAARAAACRCWSARSSSRWGWPSPPAG